MKDGFKFIQLMFSTMEKNPVDRLSSSEASDIISADPRGSDDQRERANIGANRYNRSIIKGIATHRSTKARGNFRRRFGDDDSTCENQPNKLPLAVVSYISQTPGDLCDGGFDGLGFKWSCSLYRQKIPRTRVVRTACTMPI